MYLKLLGLEAFYYKYLLNFKIPGGTSRGILKQKETYFVKIKKDDKIGVGECAFFRGLSYDNADAYESKLKWLCQHINETPAYLLEKLKDFPSIQFGLEQALLTVSSHDKFELFPSAFSRGEDRIPINGLIWMGKEAFMMKQIEDKLSQGFSTLKMKIGAIDFMTELKILKSIRQRFGPEQVELRVDANGAFTPQEAMQKLHKLAEYQLHSIEQPIKAGQWETMKLLCEKSPLPIALDEELIGLIDPSIKKQMLGFIKPQYIILKPSLVGGFKGSEEWINFAKQANIGWWITSALESNIGLNAIAQFTYVQNNTMPQGLGTGGLFTNNLSSPLKVEKGTLFTNKNEKWGELRHFLKH